MPTRTPKPPPAAKEKRGRPKKPPLGQSTVFDHRIEDDVIEDALETVYENIDAYKAVQAARKVIKEGLLQRHPRVVAGLVEDDEDGPEVKKGPYALIGRFRFLAMAPVRPATPAGTKDIKAKPAGRGWKFDAQLVINGGQPVGPDQDPPEVEQVEMIVDGSSALVNRLMADAKAGAEA